MPAKVITTTPAGGAWKRESATVEAISDEGVELNVVNLYPQVKYQAVDGFGASATDGSAYTFLSMPEKCREQFLEAYFGENGLHYTMARVPIDSCDASVAPYCAMDADDPSFAGFAMRRDRETIMPFLRACERKLGQPMKLMLSPWSPPAFMKTNGERNHGGKLRREYADMWAKYVCKFVRTYRDEGFDVRCLSVQNEPNAVQRWDSCIYSPAEEREQLMEHLYPALQREGLGGLPVFIWDHNKERAFDRAAEIFDGGARGMAGGVAFHWYSGDHFDAIRLLSQRYPEKKLYFTEGCVEYYRVDKDDQNGHARMYAHELLGNLDAGAHAFIEWNFIVNAQGGPNHVQNWLEAPAMYHEDEERLELKASYSYIWHVSHFVRENAVRLATTRFSDAVNVAAFENTNGERVAILFNAGDKALEINLRAEGRVWKLKLEPNAIATALL